MEKRKYYNELGEPCKTERKFVFEEYTDKGGIGSQKIFDTKKEAVDYCKNYWYNLVSEDKKHYLEDVCGKFFVAPMWCIFDNGEWDTWVYDENGNEADNDSDTMWYYIPVCDMLKK